MTLSDLITKLEAAEEGSRELDEAIWIVEQPFIEQLLEHWNDEQRENLVTPYTRSLDAAVALCERLLPGWKWAAGNTDQGLVWQGTDAPFVGSHSDPVLSLVIATLKAYQQENG